MATLLASDESGLGRCCQWRLIEWQYALHEEGVQVPIVWFVFKAEGPYVQNKLDKRLWQTLTKGLGCCLLL